MHFHVRHITFERCVNYLLAWRLWEKLTTFSTAEWNVKQFRCMLRAIIEMQLIVDRIFVLLFTGGNLKKKRLTRSRVGGSRWSPVYAVTARTLRSPLPGGGDRSDEASLIFRYVRFRFQIDCVESPLRWHHHAQQLVRNDAVAWWWENENNKF